MQADISIRHKQMLSKCTQCLQQQREPASNITVRAGDAAEIIHAQRLVHYLVHRTGHVRLMGLLWAIPRANSRTGHFILRLVIMPGHYASTLRHSTSPLRHSAATTPAATMTAPPHHV